MRGRRRQRGGHAIGNHTLTHPLLTRLDAAAIDVLAVAEQLQQVAVAAAHIDDARPGRYHLCDQ